MVSARALIIIALRARAVEHAIEKLYPEEVAVVTSQESLEEVAVCCHELRRERGVKFTYKPLDEAMEIGEAFRRFEDVLSQFERRGYEHKDIVLDATGGTTPLRVGAALAAMMRNVQIVHQRVKQDRYTGGGWQAYSSEDIELLQMGNPLEETGLLRAGQAVELFNRRDYGAAALVFEDILQNVLGMERTHYYSGVLLLSEGYGAWDAADYPTALKRLSAAREELNVNFLAPALADRAAALVNRIATNLPFLGKMIENGRENLSLENVVDMVENARRRIVDQGRYDDGVARLYRSVEMWHQWRLQSYYSISTKAVKWQEQVDEDIRKQFLEAVQTKELPRQLGLKHARILDHLLEGKGLVDDAEFQGLLSARNSSILAHGMIPIRPQTAEKFLKYLDALVVVPENLRVGAKHADLVVL